MLLAVGLTIWRLIGPPSSRSRKRGVKLLALGMISPDKVTMCTAVNKPSFNGRKGVSWSPIDKGRRLLRFHKAARCVQGGDFDIDYFKMNRRLSKSDTGIRCSQL